MTEVLTTEEINQLLNDISASDIKSEVKDEIQNSRKIRIYDFKRPDKFSKEQIRTLAIIHETFARLTTTGLSAQLRIMAHVHVASIDQLTLEEFLMSIPNPTTLGIVDMNPLNGTAVFEIDPLLSFAIIDRLFGGKDDGNSKAVRELTEIEQTAIEGVMVRLLGNLREAWSNVIDLKPGLGRIEVNPQFAKIVPPDDMIMLISLDAKIGEVVGKMNLCIPYNVLEPVMNKLSPGYIASSNQEEGVSNSNNMRMIHEKMKRIRISNRIRFDFKNNNITWKIIKKWKKGNRLSIDSNNRVLNIPVYSDKFQFNKTKTLPLPLSFVIEEEPLPIIPADKLKVEEKQTLNQYAGRSGFIMINDAKICRAIAAKDKKGNLFLELLNSVDSKKIENIILNTKIPVTVELSKKLMSLKEIYALHEGSILTTDESAGETFSVYLDHYSAVIAECETIVIEKYFGMRLTKMVNNSNIKSMTVSTDSLLPVRVVFGRALVSIKDLLDFKEGSIIELDKTITDPCNIEIEGILFFKGEVKVVNELFGIRILEIISESYSNVIDEKAVVREQKNYDNEAIENIENQIDRLSIKITELENEKAAIKKVKEESIILDNNKRLEIIDNIIKLVTDNIDKIVLIIRKWLSNDERKKAAILLITIGSKASSEIYKKLKEDELEQLTFEIGRVDYVKPIDRDKVLVEFKEALENINYNSTGGIDYAKEVLENAFGTKHATEIINKLTSSLQIRPFDFIGRIDPIHLLNLLQNELPQTIALVLSYLDAEKSSKILEFLPNELQSEVAKRISMMDRVSPEALREIERVLEKKLSTLASEDYLNSGGIENSAKILNLVDKATERTIIENIKKEDHDLAEEIKKRLTES